MIEAELAEAGFEQHGHNWHCVIDENITVVIESPHSMKHINVYELNIAYDEIGKATFASTSAALDALYDHYS